MPQAEVPSTVHPDALHALVHPNPAQMDIQTKELHHSLPKYRLRHIEEKNNPITPPPPQNRDPALPLSILMQPQQFPPPLQPPRLSPFPPLRRSTRSTALTFLLRAPLSIWLSRLPRAGGGFKGRASERASRRLGRWGIRCV